jgi:hypothetical protein
LVLFYSPLNQPPNFGYAPQPESLKLTTAKAAKPSFWPVLAAWITEFAAVSGLRAGANNVQINEQLGR